MPKRKLIVAYIVLVGLPILGLLSVLDAGRGLTAPPATAVLGKAASSATVSALTLPLLILQIGVIIILARLAGSLFKKINQPQVIGEMAAGILLGPSLLSWVAPSVSATVFPLVSLDYLNAFSQIGLVLFMFLVGLAMNTQDLNEYGPPAAFTSHVSIVIPFFLGSVTALFLYPRLADSSVSFTGFALFMAAALSISAFPVLARILAERNLIRTRLGTLAIACAAVDDVTGWCVLAYIVVLVRVSRGSIPVWVTIGGALVYVAVMLLVVKRAVLWFEKSYKRHGKLTDNAMAAIILLILGSALATHLLDTFCSARSCWGRSCPRAPSLRHTSKRGLMQLVILNLGLDVGVISPAVFSMMVVMALLTTSMTVTLLDATYRAPKLTAEAAA